MALILSVTGHRPEKLSFPNLPPYSPQSFAKLVLVAEEALKEHSPIKVISGLALGWDSAVCQACINLGIPYIGAAPFHGQESKWPKSSQDEYHRFTAAAENIVIVSEGGYAAWKMQVRNCWMIDNSDKLLACWDGSSGGTGNAVVYAKRIGKDMVNCWNIFETIRDL